MKFRVKNQNGEEFEFEGEYKDFAAILRQLPSSLFETSRARREAHTENTTGSKPTAYPTTSREPMTTTAIAVRLGCKSGPDLFIAAATKLTFYDGKEAFARGEVLKEMGSANSFFTENHRKNLSKSVRKLIADRKINERSKDVYVLAIETRSEVAKKLGVRLTQ